MIVTDICADCAVRDQALCGSLTDRELGALNTLGRRQKVARGETVIWAGAESVICANLLSGVLKLTASTPDGREQTVGLLYPADFVGRPYAGEADVTVTALTDAELCVFPRSPFEKVLEDHVRMERLLLQRTFTALEEARRRMLMLARSSAGEKVAALLLGMSIETVSRQMTALKDAGIVALPGIRAVTIRDRPALEARAGTA